MNPGSIQNIVRSNTLQTAVSATGRAKNTTMKIEGHVEGPPLKPGRKTGSRHHAA